MPLIIAESQLYERLFFKRIRKCGDKFVDIFGHKKIVHRLTQMNTDKSKDDQTYVEEVDSILTPGYTAGALYDLTEKVIGCAYNVSNTLGCGFLEKVYENALAIELNKAGFKVVQQHPIEVKYDGIVVGTYFADIIVNDVLIVEVKALSALADSHKAQILNYLKATGFKLGLLINFGRPKVEIKRAAL